MADGAFQKQVAYVAFIIFLILMALTALMMAKFKEHQLYPPEVPPCPDYWERFGLRFFEPAKCFPPCCFTPRQDVTSPRTATYRHTATSW